MSFDPGQVFDIELRDGTPLRLRAITPADRDRIAEAIRQLSPESAYFRFWTRARAVNPRLIEALCSPDQQDHVAWAALHRARADLPGVGGASFWRLAEEVETAEMSITVADEFQGRGVATWLQALLWEHARALGIRRLVGHVLGGFRPEEQTEIQIAVQRAADASILALRSGLGAAMNLFNQKTNAKPPTQTPR